MTRAIILTLGALLAGCAAGAASTAPGPRPPAEASPPTLLVALQRQGCTACRSYRLEIDTYGEVHFHSQGRICTQAPDVVRLRPEAVVALRTAVARSGFATADENCCDNCLIFDAETVTLTVADGAAPKTILDKECPKAPTTVRDLAQTIETVIGIERWIGPDPDEGPSWCG